jgi:hypothetical protein
MLRGDVLLAAAVLSVAGAGAGACFPEPSEDAGYPVIESRLEPLRAAFNADPDNVRAILLASPT